MEQVKKVSKLNPDEAVPFVGEALKQVSAEVGNGAAVLGFVGAPFTLASYIVEGGSSKNFENIKRMAFSEPDTLHALLDKLADNVADYCRYQADSGAQVIQIFDSWASQLMPQDFDVFAGPYIKKVIDSFKKTHPHVPIILYISGGGGLLERMAECKPDCISIDQSVDLVDGIKRIGKDFAIQGNMDPGVLFGSKETIEERVMDVVKKARSQGVRHVMNLGHGVLPGTPEENVKHYFEVARTAHQRW
jgi:uroporphyrinogen decarboxylase